MLLTRPPLPDFPNLRWGTGSLDLHVLSTPPAFVLSQDQTLRGKSSEAVASVPYTVNPSPHHAKPYLQTLFGFQGSPKTPIEKSACRALFD